MNSEKSSTFRIRLSRRAANYLKRLDRHTQERIAEAIGDLRQNPCGGPRIKPLEGTSNGYRYRVGSLRILYIVDLESRTIDITSIGPRGDIYK